MSFWSWTRRSKDRMVARTSRASVGTGSERDCGRGGSSSTRRTARPSCVPIERRSSMVGRISSTGRRGSPPPTLRERWSAPAAPGRTPGRPLHPGHRRAPDPGAVPIPRQRSHRRLGIHRQVRPVQGLSPPCARRARTTRSDRRLAMTPPVRRERAALRAGERACRRGGCPPHSRGRFGLGSAAEGRGVDAARGRASAPSFQGVRSRVIHDLLRGSNPSRAAGRGQAGRVCVAPVRLSYPTSLELSRSAAGRDHRRRCMGPMQARSSRAGTRPSRRFICDAALAFRRQNIRCRGMSVRRSSEAGRRAVTPHHCTSGSCGGSAGARPSCAYRMTSRPARGPRSLLRAAGASESVASSRTSCCSLVGARL